MKKRKGKSPREKNRQTQKKIRKLAEFLGRENPRIIIRINPKNKSPELLYFEERRQNGNW